MTCWLRVCWGRRLRPSLAGLAAVGLAVALACTAAAQAPEPKAADPKVPDPKVPDPGGVRLILSGVVIDDTPTAAQVDKLRTGLGALRPNVDQEFLTYLYLDKPRAGKLTVKLFSGKAEVASSETVTVTKEDQWVRVPWKGEPAAPDKPVPLAEIQGPASLRVVNDKGEEVPGSSVNLYLNPPRRFLKATLEYIPRSATDPNYLVAKVWHTGNFSGPPAKVEMVLDPDRIPGYLRNGKKARGNLAGPLTAANDSEANALTLIAKDIYHTPGENGWVTLGVDGYEHAFSFPTTFSTSDTNLPTTQPSDKPMLRLRALTPPDPKLPDPKLPVRITAEAEELPGREKDRLVLEVVTEVPDPKTKGIKEQATLLDTFQGERNVRLLYAKGGRQGGLRLETKVTDWFRDLDRRDFNGRIRLRLQAFEKGKVEPIKVRNGGSDADEEVDGVTREIIIDDTQPIIESLGAAVDEKTKKPGKVIPGKSLQLRAVGRDDESGIREVIFFAGRPTTEKLIPMEAVTVKAKRSKTAEDAWVGDFQVPRDLTGPLIVSVRFINGAGLFTDLTATLPVDAEAVAKGGKGSIAGTVMSGDRPQQGATVVLSIVGGKADFKTTKTNDYGDYEFKDLDPGNYVVSSIRTADSTMGQVPVTVPAEEDKKDVKDVVIKLYR